MAFFLLTFLITWLLWLACAQWGSRLPLLLGLGGPIFLVASSLQRWRRLA